MFMKKLISLLFVFFSIQLSSQTIDTLMLRYHTDGTTDTLSISKIDSIIFRYDSVLANYRISGKVLDSLNNIVDSGKVFLLHLNQSSEADTVQIATLNTYGTYEFDQVDPGLYLLRVEVSAISLNAVNTYYPDDFLWEEAHTLSLVQDTLGLDIHIIQLSTPSSTGSGTISGCLVEGSSFRGPGDGIDNIIIGLIRPNVSNDVYMLDETDANGCFSFQNLSDGDYMLYPDVVGIPLDTLGWSNINISGVDTETVQLVIDSNIITLSNTTTVTDVEGNTYETVVIGTQEWFAENLRTTKYRDGSPIIAGADSAIWVNDITGAYVWYDNDSITYALTYGALYNWYAVNNSAGLCPTGWHVPSDVEWSVLESDLEANGYNYDGSTTGNKYAKAMADTVLWDPSITTGAVGNSDYPSYRNKSGFSGLGGGYRSISGAFILLSDIGKWWSLTQDGTNDAWRRSLGSNLTGMYRNKESKRFGFSVRCLRD
jgi:uncharacterized protein (TIGR02145 family)